ncbi:cilium assembly protein DZIP1L [Chanos chanos]|uniref:Cilium assembly protein DZIP1L n=1 Tax=Chanos chanos TaxID=29144 RepID=A0A6J2WRZ0_CHACN|nr:zinc finger protein DZIP1L [Chanos chanos]
MYRFLSSYRALVCFDSFMAFEAFPATKLFFSRPLIMPGQFSSESLSALVSTPSWSPGTLQPFHFRTRTEPVDWRRLAALDVDRVAREMDVGTLQEFITAVTFCDVGAERCPHCRGPADPPLLKLLHMSQLCTEYLLHTQDYLSAQLASLEERLQGALSQAEKEREERAHLDAELQAVKQECRRRKKLIATQQLLLQSSANNYHKCQFCEKSFMNYSYLQAHLQRRHPEITDAERQKKKQVEQMEDVIEELKEKLRMTQSMLEAERETETLRRQQEQEEQRRREGLQRLEMERWKEEERKKIEEEMGEMKQLLQQELKDMANKSSSIEAKILELQSRDLGVSSLGMLLDEDERGKKERELKERMAKKKSEWKKRLKEAQNRHQQEKEELQTENVRLQRALSEESPSLQRLQRQVTSLSTQIRQKDRLIHTQEGKIKILSARPMSDPPAPVSHDLVSTEEEEEDVDEVEHEAESLEENVESFRNLPESPRGDPALVRQFRPILEDTLEEKLEKMGLRKGTKGISKQTLKSLSALVSRQWQQRLKQQPGWQDLREGLERELTHRVKRAQKGQRKYTPDPAKQRKKKHLNGVQQKSLKSSQSNTKPSPQNVKSQQAPQPTPRSKIPAQIQRIEAKKKSTPPFSSEEESVEDSVYMNSSRSKPPPTVRVIQSGAGSTPVPEPMEDWSDSDLSEGLLSSRPRQTLSTHGSVVQSLTRSLERQLSAPMTKPQDGTGVLPPPTTSLSSRPTKIVKQLAFSDVDSDLELSSIEEITPHPAGVRGSSDVGGTSGTSVWSSSASRAGVW